MKPLILVGSCKKNQDAGCLDAIRETWAKDSEIPYRFFLGKDCIATHDDELVFNVIDGYFEQNPKHQAALKWALDHDYTHVFLCDDDTFVSPKRLLRSGWETAHYRGNMKDTPRPGEECGVEHDYCHGGCGYWLDAESMRAVVAAEFDLERPDHRIDDQWFGLVLRDAGILPEHDYRYSMGTSYGKAEPPVLPTNDVISCHLSRTLGNYRPEWMRDSYLQSLKVLIACSTCWRDVKNGSDAAIRETWGRKLPPNWDLYFFVGGIPPDERFDVPMDSPGPGSIGPMAPANAVMPFSVPLQNDEIVLDCPDGYFYLPWKTTESLKWALERDYDWIFRIFADTYVFPDRLYKSQFWKHDFSGRSFTCPPCKVHPDEGHSAPHGGCGYFTSAKAARAVLGKEVPTPVSTVITHWG